MWQIDRFLLTLVGVLCSAGAFAVHVSAQDGGGQTAAATGDAAAETKANTETNGAAGDKAGEQVGGETEHDTAGLPPAVTDEQRRLLRQLGSESFAERSEAEDALRELGMPVRAALEEGLDDDDLQVRRTCRRLLNDILEADYQRRLMRFLRDKQGREQHDLAGWERFRQLVGDTSATRKLFGEMHQEEGALLISTEAGNVATGEALEIRYDTVLRLMRHRNARERVQPSAATVTALLFVATDPRLAPDDSTVGDHAWTQLTNSAGFRQRLAEGDASPACRKVLGQWILLPTDPRLLNNKLRLAIQYSLPEGLELALDTLENRGKMNPAYLSYAIEAVGKLGGKPYAAKLAPLLEEKGVISRRRVNKKVINIELRDVALAWLVFLTDQDLKQYHFPRAKTIFDRIKQDPRKYAVSYAYLCFDSAENRAKAFARWREWVEQHPLPDPPQPEASREAQPAPQPAGR